MMTRELDLGVRVRVLSEARGRDTGAAYRGREGTIVDRPSPEHRSTGQDGFFVRFHDQRFGWSYDWFPVADLRPV